MLIIRALFHIYIYEYIASKIYLDQILFIQVYQKKLHFVMQKQLWKQ